MRRGLTTFLVLGALLAASGPVLAQYPPNPGDCVITVRSQLRGRFIRITGRANCADQRVRVQYFLESQATYLGESTSAGDGSYDSGDMLVPVNTPPGQHTARVVTTKNGNRADYTTPMTIEGESGNAASGNQTTAAGAPVPPGNSTTSGGNSSGSSTTGGSGTGAGGVAGTGAGTGTGTGTGVGGTAAGTGAGGTAGGVGGTSAGGAPGAVAPGSTVGGTGGSGGVGGVGGIGRPGTGIPGLGSAGVGAAGGAGGNLPTTGMDIALLVMWATLLLGAGTLLVTTTWRRLRPATVSVRPKPMAERVAARGFDHAFSADLRSVVPGTPTRGYDAPKREEPNVPITPTKAPDPTTPSDPVASLQDEIRSWIDDDAN